MTKLHERLYQYIAEERFHVLRTDQEFIRTKQTRDQLEEELSATLTAAQWRLFSRYMDEENQLDSLQLRHVFQETLALVPTILSISL